MDTQPQTLSSKDAKKAAKEIRGPEIGPALKRDMLLQRVRAARKRLSPISSNGLAGLR